MKLFCDLDGTLLDVSVRHYKIYVEVTTDFGGKPLDKKAYWDLKRSKAKWPEILPASGLKAEVVDKYLDKFRDKIESPEYLKLDQPFPGVIEVIEELAGMYQCYLVSLRRNANSLRAELEWLGLAPYFTQVLMGHSESDGVDVKVPLIRSVLGTDIGVIIGDTEADILTGKKLGLTTIAVASGLRTRELLVELQPDHIIDTIADVPAILRG